MKYQIVEDDSFLLIKISGKTVKNETVMAKKMLFPHLKKKGIKVIIDMRNLESFELITILGIFNALRKEIMLAGGSMKLCCLKPNIIKFLKQNRLDQMFLIYKDMETAIKSAGSK